MSKPFNVAIIGCGYWGVNYARLFQELPNVYLAAICDQRPARLAELAKRFPDVRLTTAIDEILQMRELDGVVICTSATTHFAIASACIARGKHLLIEKPITTTSADAQALITLAAQHGVTLMVGHTFLYNPGIQKVRQYLSADDMGSIYYLYARRTNLGPIREDVNAIWDLAPHDVAIFNYLLHDTPQWVSAVGTSVLKNGRADVGFIALNYANDILGHIHISWADPNKVRELVVVGANKRIVFDDLNAQERVKIFEKGVAMVEPTAPNFGEFHFQLRDGDIFSPRVEVSEPLKNQCLHFVECAMQGKRPLTDGLAGLRVVQVMEAVDQSLAQHGAPVVIPTEIQKPSSPVFAPYTRNGVHR